MANSLLTSTKVLRRALMILHQKLNFVGSINRQYDDSFAQEGAKIGDTLKIRLPNEYEVTDGATMSAQDTNENSTSLTVSSQKHVAMNFSTAELTLSIDDFAERIIEPAMARLAAKVEADAMNMYKDVYNQVNQHGSAMTFKKLLDGSKNLTDNLTPYGKRCLCMNTTDNVDLVDALKGLFQDSTQIKKQYKEGRLGTTASFGDVFENTLLPSHTVGAGSGYLVNGASQTGASLIVDTGTGAIKQGDIFTIAGVNRVHPETKADTGVLQQFVATADYAGGGGTISISPSITTSGASQTVSASPADNAAITIAGTASTAHGLSLGFHRDAFTFATADLVMPKGVDFSARENYDGISLRIVRQYDINNDKLPCRVDVLYGYKAQRPQLANRYAAN